MPTDTQTAIKDNAVGPKSAEVDGVTIVQHPLPDQIAADKYLAGTTAGTKTHRGIRYTKIAPPGAA